MKLLLGAGLGLLLLATLPAMADTTSDLAQCEKTVKFKTGDMNSDDIAVCMKPLGYALETEAEVDELTKCRNLTHPGIEVRCYGKPGMAAVGRVPSPLPVNWTSLPIDQLIAEEEGLNEMCRDDGPSLFFTEDACNRRDRMFMTLKARGWCWQTGAGKEDFEANKIWQACRKDPN